MRERRPSHDEGKESQIQTTLLTPELNSALDELEERGFVHADELEVLAEANDLGEDELEELTTACEERGIDVRTDVDDDADELVLEADVAPPSELVAYVMSTSVFALYERS